MPKKKTKEEFIKEATEKHEGKYDYSKVEYVNAKTKVCIICPEHREFWQTPTSHLSGNGCPECGVKNRSEKRTSTKEEFIKKAREKHNGKYDYSQVTYIGTHNKACIICPEHGEFWQKPSHHLSGCGCPECRNEANGERCRSSKEEFIKKAKEVHKNKYDYSKVHYVNSRTNVCIICSEHGEFWQRPSNHLSGYGCSKCGNEKKRKILSSSKEDFIEKAREVHCDKYDYSSVEYFNNATKVCIKCPSHGEFWQTPANHLNDRGCPKCSGKYSPTTEEFIKKARKEHGNKYDYSKVNYVNALTKVCIICTDHGEFWQTPSSHLSGKGCQKCNLSHLERNVMNYLDEMGITYDYQKRFKWLGMQSLDFYLPDYNVGIECQGEQHFFPIDFEGKGVEWACKEFDENILRDKKKKTLCEEHGVKLLYFGNVPNYDTFLGEVVHDDVQYLIDYLNEHKINGN